MKMYKPTRYPGGAAVFSWGSAEVNSGTGSAACQNSFVPMRQQKIDLFFSLTFCFDRFVKAFEYVSVWVLDSVVYGFSTFGGIGHLEFQNSSPSPGPRVPLSCVYRH